MEYKENLNFDGFDGFEGFLLNLTLNNWVDIKQNPI